MPYIEERNPFFPVRKEEVQTVSGIPVNKVALINDDTGDILGLASPNYEVVENKFVDDLFMEAIGNISIYEITDYMDATTKKWHRRFIFNSDDTNVEITKGDNVNILLEVFNGYDARTSFGFNLMSYRYICENGMVMGKESLFKETYTHYEGSADKLRNSFTMKFDAYRGVTDKWKQWTKEDFSMKMFEEFIVGRKYLGPRVKDAIVSSYEPVMNKENLEENKWGAFNVLTYLATHETKANKGSNLFSAKYNNINRAANDFYTYKKR